MSARLLAIITPGEEATALAGFTGLAAIARAAGAEVRLASFRDLPAPRVDRHDHVVADPDAEMARITSATTQALDAAARRYSDVRMESVVRFGKTRREVLIETDALCAADRGPVRRVRGWAVAAAQLGAAAAPGPAPRPAALRPGDSAGCGLAPELRPGAHTAGTPPSTSRLRSGCLAQPRRSSAVASIQLASLGRTTPPERTA
jgi:hypothetical protein